MPARLASRTRLARLILIAAALGLSADAHAQFETTQVSGLGARPLYMTKSMPWTWEDLAPSVSGVTYNVYRRLPGDGFRCLVSNLTTPDYAGDPQNPAPGEVYWYSLTADDTWGENLHGNAVPIVERCVCSGPPPVSGTPPLSLQVMATGLGNIVHLTSPPGDPSRLFVVNQAGRIRIIERGVLQPTAFLDITGLVESGGTEQGLLSMAFHPNYPADPRFFVYHNEEATFTIVVASYEVSAANPDLADDTTRVEVLRCDHPSLPGEPRSNHNGGQIAFGPDGYLYIGTGDGGGGGDPDENADKLRSCLGKMLRIDIDGTSPPLNYRIPPDNPFVSRGACCTTTTCLDLETSLSCQAQGGNFAGIGSICASTPCAGAGACCSAGGCTDGQSRSQCVGAGGTFFGDATLCDDGEVTHYPCPFPEIWAYGLRNPWRFSFDRSTGDLYIGDVGQGAYEEIDVQPAASTGGEHYGWDTVEGDNHCYEPATGCDFTGKTRPVLDYDRGEGTSVTGGVVYRGCRLPGYHGTYFYADYNSDFVRSFEYVGGIATNPLDWTTAFTGVNGPSSFGEDARGEVYILNRAGSVRRVVP